MGYAGKVKLQEKARKLRARGFSIKEIEKKLEVARSSVSKWVRDINLSSKQINRLYRNKRTGGLKGSYIASLNKIKRRKELIKKITEEARKEVGKSTSRERFIAGISLYFAEGGKRDGSLQFSNSDPRAIAFMMEWFREFCNVSDNQFKLYLYIHDNLDENKAKNFWSNLTKIPPSQFGKSYIVKNNLKRFRHTKREQGVLRISINNTNLHRKIMGWISKVFDI